MVFHTKICRHCNLRFDKLPSTSYKQWERQFCCSKACGDKSKKTPWLKSFEIKKGQHLSEATQFKKGENLASKNGNWSGDLIGYTGIHHWMESRFGKPPFCEHCKTSARRMYQWANVSGKYLRDRSDWLRLCAPCHSRYDRAKK